MTSALWNTRRRRAVERFVAAAQGRLRLTDWEVIVDFDTPAGPGAVATIFRAPDQRRAVLRFQPEEFLTCSAAHQRQTLVHELLHCHLFDLHEAAAVAIEAVPGAAHQATLTAVVRSRVELVTDSLADAFVALTLDLDVPATVAPLRAFEGATLHEQDPEGLAPGGTVTGLAAARPAAKRTPRT